MCSYFTKLHRLFYPDKEQNTPRQSVHCTVIQHVLLVLAETSSQRKDAKNIGLSNFSGHILTLKTDLEMCIDFLIKK